MHSIVFAELISYIEEMHLDDEISLVFKLADLTKMYQSWLCQLYPEGPNVVVNSTRLKEKLIANLSGLTS